MTWGEPTDYLTARTWGEPTDYRRHDSHVTKSSPVGDEDLDSEVPDHLAGTVKVKELFWLKIITVALN